MGWPEKVPLEGLLCIRVIGTVVGGKCKAFSSVRMLVEQISGGVLLVRSGPSQPSSSLGSKDSALCRTSALSTEPVRLTKNSLHSCRSCRRRSAPGTMVRTMSSTVGNRFKYAVIDKRAATCEHKDVHLVHNILF